MESANDPIFQRAQLLADSLDRHKIVSVTLIILYDLRIPLDSHGFGYLKQAIPIAHQNPSQIVASEIYTKVGENYSPEVSNQNMDAAIRDAIRKAWKSRMDDHWSRYLPDYIVEQRKPPSNLEFISAIVYFLEMWQDCYEKEADYATA